MMEIDTLYERLQDPAETFTTAEVLQIIEDTERKASNDLVNKSRIAANAAAMQQIVQDSNDSWARLIALVETNTTPELVEVGE